MHVVYRWSKKNFSMHKSVESESEKKRREKKIKNKIKKKNKYNMKWRKRKQTRPNFTEFLLFARFDLAFLLWQPFTSNVAAVKCSKFVLFCFALLGFVLSIANSLWHLDIHEESSFTYISIRKCTMHILRKLFAQSVMFTKVKWPTKRVQAVNNYLIAMKSSENEK